jgi:Na+/H+ antiporter NhaC
MCGTGNYIADALAGSLPAGSLPVLVFLLSAVTAYATGTSWGSEWHPPPDLPAPGDAGSGPRHFRP